MRKLLLIPIFISCVLLSFCSKKDIVRTGFVFDEEHVLSETQVATLDSIIIDFDSRTTNQIAIVTTDSIGDYPTMKDYAVGWGNLHGVGTAEKNNGLVIAFSKNLREVFIATGYGTEKILTNEILTEIIQSKMLPRFKKEEYYEGFKEGLEECIKKWE